MRLSVIVPTLNEAPGGLECLQALQGLRRAGHEVIVVDGGSGDDTCALAEPLADRVHRAARGRARQMNAGAALATGDVLLFLHADTRLPPDAPGAVAAGMRRSGASWGRFDVRLSGAHPLLRAVGALMNVRSRLSGIATGDQAMFVRRERFLEVGGFPDLPLMEDVALSRALRRYGRPLCLRERAVTSSRRWEQRGILRTILLMWRLRAAYALGADVQRLARVYERG